MNSEDRPQLSLGQAPGQLGKSDGPALRPWLVLLVLLQLAALGLLATTLLRRAPREPPAAAAAAGPRGSANDLRAFAQELENRSLDGQAARAWQAYLDQNPDVEEQAEILYRAGKLYMQAEQFDQAAAVLVRAEQCADDRKALKTKIGTQLVTCLRRLGLYGQVGRELSRQVEVGGGKTGRGKVLATLAGDPLTDADLDRMIARRVDQMLALQPAPADPSARQALLKRFDQPDVRQQVLEELLQTELLARRARELKFDQQEDFQKAKRELEDQLLARRFQAHELAQVEPTEVDLQGYFAANKEHYREPESLAAVLIELAPGEDAADVLKEIGSVEDFKQVAHARAGKAGEETAELPPVRIERGRADPRLGNVDTLFQLEAGKWTTEPVAHGGKQFLVLVDGKAPARTPALEEVHARVAADYVARKRHESLQALLRDLMDRYQVKIAAPKPGAGGSGSAGAGAGAGAGTAKPTEKGREEDK